MDIKPIRTEKDLDAALARVDELWGSDPGTPEGDEFEVLVTLIEAYEDIHHPIGMPDPIDAIKFHMEQKGLRQKDLVGIIGSRARVSEVLNRKRSLTLPMIRALHRELGIPAESLIQESTIEDSAA